jgi:hypothetical protein
MNDRHPCARQEHGIVAEFVDRIVSLDSLDARFDGQTPACARLRLKPPARC